MSAWKMDKSSPKIMVQATLDYGLRIPLTTLLQIVFWTAWFI